jgi:hypothetical protein
VKAKTSVSAMLPYTHHTVQEAPKYSLLFQAYASLSMLLAPPGMRACHGEPKRLHDGQTM